MGWEGQSTISRCIFMNNDGGGVEIRRGCDPTFIDCTFFCNEASRGGGLYAGYQGTFQIQGCTFYGNSATQGSGICLEELCSSMSVERTIIANGVDGAAYETLGASQTPQFSCTDIFANAGGDWVGDIAPQYGINGNISEDPLICNPLGQDFHLQEDSPCAPFTPPNPNCDLIGAWSVGCDLSAAQPPTRVAHELALAANTPRPFGSQAIISYVIPAGAARATLEIYDTSGRLIRSFIDGRPASGPGKVAWDGTNADGIPVNGGVYFCRLTADKERLVRRLVLLR